ncbi:hypothetical protein LINPERHAP2_LOCUS19591, partial [Linum perenne]
PPQSTTFLCIHCDASFVGSSQQAAYRIIIFNSDGIVCNRPSFLFHCTSPLAAEARTFKESVHYAKIAPLRCSIFSDFLSLVNYIKGPFTKWSRGCYGYLGGILKNLSSNPHRTVSFIPHWHNSRVDWVRKCTKIRSLPHWMTLLVSEDLASIQVVPARLEND